MRVLDLSPDERLSKQLERLLSREVVKKSATDRVTLSFTDYDKLVSELIELENGVEGPAQLTLQFPIREGEREYVHLVAVSPLIGQAPNTLCVREPS